MDSIVLKGILVIFAKINHNLIKILLVRLPYIFIKKSMTKLFNFKIIEIML